MLECAVNIKHVFGGTTSNFLDERDSLEFRQSLKGGNASPLEFLAECFTEISRDLDSVRKVVHREALVVCLPLD